MNSHSAGGFFLAGTNIRPVLWRRLSAQASDVERTLSPQNFQACRLDALLCCVLPLASNGCVVLSNDDITHLGKAVQVGTTPVIITNRMDWTDNTDKADRAALLKEIERWRNDWSSLDTESYLKHYARDFAIGSTDLDAWSAQKRLVNSGKSWIKVGISDISLFPYPTQPNMVVVSFEQDYASNNLVNRMKKRQYWMKRDNRWQIVYEGAA